ncbi:multiheme c-type cytochrome [Tautonia sociabilis]|nr:multiheme c-type cytochrome [Tautonia sociabilis]
MPPLRPRIALAPALLASAGLIAGWFPGATAADDLARPARGETPSGTPIRFLGANSCSANACHNRGNFRGASELSVFEPKRFWEHQYWQRFDPHVRAFEVLEGEESRRIEQNLRRLSSIELAFPERDGLCLSCHVHQNFSGSEHGPAFAEADGVSCEGCHGASELWNSAHYQDGWKLLSPERKASYGFVPLDAMADRARSCTPCHVGSSYEDPEHGLVDVNHDLIAAGHPRLNFEFASYHAQYPRHWNDLAERGEDPAYEARAWVVGQLVTAESALRLLKARGMRSGARPGDPGPLPLRGTLDSNPHAGPWPEFAEYNCYACHHDLRGGVPLAVGIASAVPGQLPWGSWSMPMVEVIGQELPPRGKDWSAIRSAIESEMTLPLPDPARVSSRVDEALATIDAWLAEWDDRPIDSETVERLIATAVEQLRESADPTWDRNAQVYLAMAALYAAQGDLDPARRDPAMAQTLDAMLNRLRFQPGMNSPHEYRVESLEGVRSAIRPRASIEE